MLNQIKEHIIEVEKFQADSAETVEQFRIKYLGKKGVLNDLFLAFKDVPNQEKKAFGQTLNELKTKAQDVTPVAVRFSNRKYSKRYFGSASLQNKNGIKKHIEGFETMLKGNELKYMEKLEELKEDLQSAVSYAGGEDITALGRVYYVINR